MDFMDAENSCPVPFRIIPLDPGTQYHHISRGVEQSWADPEIAVAADWMRRLDASPALRSEIGGRARASISSLLAEAAKGEMFAEMESMWRASGKGG